jgi:alpha-ketoglutarate-dependent taurine dioxygenase
MLYAIEIPELHGLTLGDTEFANAQAAWEALPDPIRSRIEGRRAVAVSALATAKNWTRLAP